MKKIIFILVMAAIISLMLPSGIFADPEADTHYENALKLFYEKDFCEAEIELRKALEENPYHDKARKLFREIEVMRELARPRDVEESVSREIAEEDDISIKCAGNKILIEITKAALEGIEEKIIIKAENDADRDRIRDTMLKDAIKVRAEGEHAGHREVKPGTRNPVREYVLGSDLYIFDMEATDGFVFKAEINITLEFDWELINPTLAYWDEGEEEWISHDSQTVDCNHLRFSTDDIKGRKFCILGDISTRILEEADPEEGGAAEYMDGGIKKAELAIPGEAVGNDIIFSIAKIYENDYMENICLGDGYIIDGNIYDMRSAAAGYADEEGAIDYGSFTDPFLRPAVLTLECSPDALCPKIAYFICDECCVGWEIVPTKRISDTYVRAYVYHLSKWAVLETVPDTVLETAAEEAVEEKTAVVEEEKDSEESSFILFFRNIWRKIRDFFLSLF
jgi:hypothetical protein